MTQPDPDSPAIEAQAFLDPALAAIRLAEDAVLAESQRQGRLAALNQASRGDLAARFPAAAGRKEVGT